MKHLVLDADFAWSHASFTEFDASGDYIPGAVERVASLGVTLDHPAGWFAGARLRYLGSAPLIENNSMRSDPTTLLNLETGYDFTATLSVTLSVLNALDSDDNDISYYYDSQLANENAPIADVHLHPAEPRTVRLGLRARF
jgi:outer membrane receptor protein involved in Fe transport